MSGQATRPRGDDEDVSTSPGKKSVDLDLDEVARLHAAGVSRNKTAERLNVSTRQIDKAAETLGISWSAARTEEAVAARRARAKERHLEQAEKWGDLAMDSLDRALQETDPADRRRHALTAQVATQSELELWKQSLDVRAGHHNLTTVTLAVADAFATLDETPLEDLYDAEDQPP